MSEHEVDKNFKKWNFIEVWVEVNDEYALPGVLLLVSMAEGKFYIVAPSKDYAVLASLDTYEDATFWLQEDEYSRVLGKVVPDEDA
ncbi:MAG: hypothetical protein AAFR81_01395 [Chloroflexota bacterium]